MTAIIIEIVLILVLTIINGLFSMSEIAIVSARRSRLRQQAERGDRGAEAATRLAESPLDFLATVQIGITTIGILSGAFGGATLAEHLGAWLNRYEPIDPHGENVALALIVLGITYLSLVIGELLPKRIGLANPERMATLIARPMQFLSRAATPLVKFLSASTSAIIRILRLTPSNEPDVTHEDVVALVEQGTTSGIFAREEQDIVERSLRLKRLRAGAIMTPRDEIVWLDIEAPWEKTIATLRSTSHARLPVCRKSTDEILGILYLKDLLDRTLAGETLDILAVAHPPFFVPEHSTALDLLQRIKDERARMAVVVDEFGSVLGLITLHDLLESLVGEVLELGEEEEPEAIQREDGSWLLDGQMTIDEATDLLSIQFPPLPHVHTLGGYIMARLGKIPQSSDFIDIAGYRLEVVDMDRQRIDKVLARVNDHS